MTKATFLRNNPLLGVLALTLLSAALLMAHLRGGVSMEVGELSGFDVLPFPTLRGSRLERPLPDVNRVSETGAGSASD